MYKLGQHLLKNRKNQKNNISMNFSHETHEQQLTRSEELLQQLHQQVQHQQQELPFYDNKTIVTISHNHFRIVILMLVLFLMKNKTL